MLNIYIQKGTPRFLLFPLWSSRNLDCVWPVLFIFVLQCRHFLTYHYVYSCQFPLLECKPQGGRDFYVSFTDETQMYQTVWDIAGIQYLFNEWVNDWKSAFWKTHSIPNVLILWKILNIILDLFWERAVTQWRTEGAVSLSSQGWSYECVFLYMDNSTKWLCL